MVKLPIVPEGDEYVVTDAAGVFIAAVRPSRWMRGDVPPWWDHGNPWSSEKRMVMPERAIMKMWWDRHSCAVVLGNPGATPALLIASEGVRSGRAGLWMASGAQLGTVEVRSWVFGRAGRPAGCGRARAVLGGLRFSRRSTDTDVGGTSPTYESWVRPRRFYRPNDAWIVMDAAGLERLQIARRSRLPAATGEPDQPDGLTLTQLRRATRDILASRPVACEVIESRPDFDWDEHGPEVALAALCDRSVRHRAFPHGWGPP